MHPEDVQALFQAQNTLEPPGGCHWHSTGHKADASARFLYF
jgi:hypothetical protein